jgi:ribonuclease HII
VTRTRRAAQPSPIRIGLDEAGLGPTLGPLVIGSFATREHETGDVDELRTRLAEIVAEPPARDGRLEVGDSKAIHTGAHKLARLERTALATLAAMQGELPRSVAELFARVLVTEHEQPIDRSAPWWRMLDEALPLACAADELLELGARLRSVAERRGVELLDYRADLLDAARINRELDDEHRRAEGTKNTWSTHAVLRLAVLRRQALGGGPTTIACDMAGGRRSYAGALRRAFALPEPAPSGQLGLLAPLHAGERDVITVLAEARDACRYRLELDAPLALGFFVGGDRLDPRISWASILAKYLRELLLRPFNRYFAARVPGLRPTAGYPEDAKRFIAEVEAGLAEPLPFARGVWIRSK